MKMNLRLCLALGVFALGARLPAAQSQTAGPASQAVRASNGPFLVKPYLQLGDNPTQASANTLELLWHTEDVDANWSVECRAQPDQRWRECRPPATCRVAVVGIPPHRIYHAALKGLVPGGVFSYRVRKAGIDVFSAEARARKTADQPYRFVAFGDCGAGTLAQKAIAYRAYQLRPDFVLIPGDIVYSRGRVSEYREKFWRVYNDEEPSPAFGAPLMRSALFVAAPGNHDIASRDLQKFPDGLAYFFNWDQPLNGPPLREGSTFVPPLTGPQTNVTAFRQAAGPAYPRMGNFSFDYGNAHWTVLDSNDYVDWTDREHRAWIERDLTRANTATWRFVVYHHPGFNSAKSHFNQQQTRLMSAVFEAGKVDIVFNGHVHNYQRSYPLRFVPDPVVARKPERIGGRWTLDRSFDGRTRTKPDGVIYVVTGAGGANLYNTEQHDDRESWQEFTDKFLAKVHSLTVADVDGGILTVRQLSAEGEELDRFMVTK
jgi:hypothetical protein